jgi:Protein of unknown function (DUF3987)
MGGQEYHSRSGSTGTTNEDPPHAWRTPDPLPSGLRPVPSFPEALLPEPLRPWLADVAERMQCPLDFPAVGAVVGLASVIGKKVAIRPERFDDWTVILNLWGVIVGRPGIMKTPALMEVVTPLKRLEIAAWERHDEAMRKWEANSLIKKMQRDAAERALKEQLREQQKQAKSKSAPKTATLEPDAAGATDFRAAAEEILRETADPPPTVRRYLVNDATVEKLGVILNENPNGVLLFRDELAGWLYSMDREGHENDRAFYLESWNGNGVYTYDRIGRGTLYVDSLCVSLLGGIQPGRLSDYLRHAIHGGRDDDGLAQRLQLLVYPDDLATWRHVERWPDSAAKRKGYELYTRLSELTAGSVGALQESDDPQPFLRFAPDAQVHFNEWRADLERKIRAGDTLPALEAHLAKYRSLIPSLALLFHLLDDAPQGKVALEHIERATAWADFLEAHARRIYGVVTDHEIFAAHSLARHILAGDVQSPFAARRLAKKGWAKLTDATDVHTAAIVLEEHHWLYAQVIPSGVQGGRPSTLYYINPAIAAKSGRSL